MTYNVRAICANFNTYSECSLLVNLAKPFIMDLHCANSIPMQYTSVYMEGRSTRLVLVLYSSLKFW